MSDRVAFLTTLERDRYVQRRNADELAARQTIERASPAFRSLRPEHQAANVGITQTQVEPKGLLEVDLGRFDAAPTGATRVRVALAADGSETTTRTVVADDPRDAEDAGTGGGR